MSLTISGYGDSISLSTPFSLQSKLFHEEKSVHSDKAIGVYQTLLSSSLKYFMKEYRAMIKAQKKARGGGGHSHSHSHSHSHGGNECDGHDDDEEEEEEDDLSSYDQMPTSEQRRILHALLTIRPPVPIDSSVLSQLDELLYYEQQHRDRVSLSSIPPVTARLPSLPSPYTSLSVWKGDITTLAADCIVNAANSQLLGCFAPSHRCIDNIIHSACGPRLRLDCLTIMEKQGEEEGEGNAKITRSYHLPSRYIAHTVGPQLPDSRDHETEEERKLLANCYRSCLNEAEKVHEIKSIAFNCISTGLFRFPAPTAAKIAVDTCVEWLTERKKEGKSSSIERIIFNVFKETDEQYYWNYLSTIAGITPIASSSLNVSSASSSSSSSISSSLALAQQWVSEGELLLIAGAAGLSASAGLDYTSETIFRQLYPAMHRRGFRNMYQFIGYTDWSLALQWGYFLSHANTARLLWPKTEIYQSLLSLTQCFPSDNSFVFTSNADGMFGTNGFDLNRVYTIQGDYGKIQCLRPCRRDAVFDIRPFVEAALPFIDKNTQEITKSEVIPKCPYCHGAVMYNVRGGDWFIEDHLLSQRKKYLQFINHAIESGKKLVILEIGVGFNTPSVIRWPMERLCEKNDNIKLIRINAERAEIPMHINKHRAVGIAMDATEAVRIIVGPRLEKAGKALWKSESSLSPPQLALENVAAGKKKF